MNLISYISNPLIAGILGAIGGVVLTLATKLGEGWINEFFEIRKQKRDLRIQAAQDITSFVVEGMHKGFRIKAGSEHHIKFRATEIEAIDLDVGTKLRTFLSYWSQYRNFSIGHTSDIENEKMAIQYNNKAQKLGDELLEVARKWSK